MKIINVPIEPLPDRYSIDWHIWFLDYFESKLYSDDIITILGDQATQHIEHGSFLDVINTNEYKTSQLSKIIRQLKYMPKNQKIILFFHDLWFPGLINIKYMIDGMGWKNVHIVGCLHAGSYDPYDFLAKKRMTKWALPFEQSILNIADGVFVATEFHKQMLVSLFSVFSSKIKVTGFPIRPVRGFETNDKEKIIVFPHRLDDEKQPYLFDRLANKISQKYPDWQFIKTKEVIRNKKEYYELLSKSYISVSCALQETWGIAMQESVLLDCIPIVPDRLSYKEMYRPQFKYDGTRDDLIEITLSFIERYPTVPERVGAQKNDFLESGAQAIPNMFKEISIL